MRNFAWPSQRVLPVRKAAVCGAMLAAMQTYAADGDTTAAASRLVFEWAEYAYPSLFSPANAPTRVIQGFDTRYYPATGHYLGVKDGVVYGVGAAFSRFTDIGGGIRRLGEIAAFSAAMTRDGFAIVAGERLVVSEALAKSSDGSADWIELHAAGTQAVALKQYQLRDGGDNRLPETLPDITLQPGEYLVIPTSADTTLAAPYQLHFSLGNNDRVQLLRDGVVVDDLDWEAGEAVLGRSFGRYPGPYSAGITLLPTPAARNAAATRGPLVINEISASSSSGEDWFELYNAGDTALMLATYTIIDDSDDGTPVRLPAQTLAPRAYVRFFAVGSSGNVNSSNFPFKLGANDSLTLRLGGAIADHLEWNDGDAPTDFSYGSVSDGAFATATLKPTPAARNSGAAK
jgi:hypothetical protein